MQRILIIDDHHVVQAGIRQLFAEHSLRAEVAIASTYREALQAARERDWDLALLDISLAGRNGLELLPELLHLRPRLRVLVFTMHAEEQYAKRCFKAGAKGYVTKGSSSEELFRAIQSVLKGGHYVTPELAEKIIFTADAPPHELLSDREYDVMLRLAAGQKNKEIADALRLDTRTISTYRARILEKMNLSTTADINAYARQQALLK